ncbi:ABC transporter permease, partial [Photobacterium damselae]|uniref:ABC transporter permease n=1 Tax=Photobacterium damselae TaxID=38293 RepID=UPI002F41B798
LLSSTSYLANAQIVKKTSFPRFVLPLSNILMESIHFLITIPVIILFLYIYSITPNYLAILLYTPVIMLFQIGFTFGLGLVFSSLNVFFRDIERLLSIVMLLWFYVTPIIYSIDLIPKEIVSYMRLNPILPFIESWRELFLNGEISTQYLIPMLINSGISLVLGSLFYFKLKDKFSEVL